MAEQLFKVSAVADFDLLGLGRFHFGNRNLQYAIFVNGFNL
ncbi:MAG: hypothetical protein R3B54_03515 [Bdellovibrionota bacterium]